MATSLALQLRKHQTAQSSALKPTRSSASFLYDPKQCASIDRDTHLLIALSGLSELAQLDPIAESFRDSLFSGSARSLDRAQLSFDEHKALNEELDRYFAQVLSPFFLHSASHKTLEWLVQRFRVHEYNVDSLIFALLPFHETRHFARVLQMCVLDDKSTFEWLQPLQKIGVPLVKSVLHQHLTHNLDRFRFLVDRLVSLGQQNLNIARLASFVTSTFICLIQRQPPKQKTNQLQQFHDQLLPLLIQFISRSLSLEQCRTLTICAYTLLSFVCTKFQLTERRLTAILNRLATNYSKFQNPPVEDFTICLSIVCRHQKNLPVPLPESLVDQILPLILNHPEQHSDEQHLLTSLAASVVHRVTEEKYTDKIDQLLQLLKPDNFLAVQQILTQVCAVQNDPAMLPRLNWLVRLVEQRFPNAFDHVLAISEQAQLDSDQPQSRLHFSNSLFDGSLYLRVDNSSISLATALSHPSRSIRLKAIDKLAEVSIDTLDDSVKQMIGNSVRQALCTATTMADEVHFNSLNRMLKVETITQLLTRDDLLSYGFRLLDFCTSRAHNESSKTIHTLRDRIIALLLQLDYDQSEFIDRFICYMFPSSDQHVQTLKALLVSPTFESIFGNKTVVQIQKLIESADDNSEAILTDLLKLYANPSNFEIFCQSLSKYTETKPFKHFHCFAHLLLMQSVLRHLNLTTRQLELHLNQAVFLLRTLIKNCDLSNRLFDATTSKKSSESLSIHRQLSLIFNGKNKLREDFVVGVCLKTIVESLQAHQIGSNNSLSSFFEDIEHCSLIPILNLICELRHSQRMEGANKLLINFIKRCDSFYNHQLFVSLWSHSFDPQLQSRALSISLHSLPVSYRLTEAQTLHLLVALGSPSQSVRTLAVRLIRHMDPNSNALLSHILNATSSLSTSINTDDESAAPCEDEVMRETASLQILSSFLPSKKSTSSNESCSSTVRELICSFLRDSSESVQFKIGLIKLMRHVADNEFLETLICVCNEVITKASQDKSQCDSPDAHMLRQALECLMSYFANQTESYTGKDQYNYKPLISLFSRISRHPISRSFAINRINGKWFARIRSVTLRIKLIETLVNECHAGTAPITHLNEVKRRLVTFLKDSRLPAHLLRTYTVAQTHVISKGSAAVASGEKRVRLEKRLSFDCNQAGWAKTIILLEALQSADTLTHSSTLLRELLAILSDVVTSHLSSEYLMQLLLLNIRKCVLHPDCDVQSLDVGLIFECLRTTRLRATQRHLLDLLSLLAPHFRSQVLDNLLNTFIGQFPVIDMMRCNDDLSLQVLDRAMQSLLPPLFERGGLTTRIQILDSFIDALVEMSADRKLHVFEMLIRLMNTCSKSNDSLWIVLHRIARRVLTEQTYELSSLGLFMQQIVARFPIATQLTALISLLDHLLVSIDKPDEQELNLLLVDQLQKTLAAHSFVSGLAEQDLSSAIMSKHFIQLLEKILLLLSRLNHTNSINLDQQADNSIYGRLTSALDRYIRLLPSIELTRVLNQLLAKDQIHVRTRILRILIDRLQSLQSISIDDENKDATWRSLLIPLTHVIVRTEKEPAAENVLLDAQLALLAIKLLVDKCPKTNEMLDLDWSKQLKNTLTLILRISQKLQLKHFTNKEKIQNDESIADLTLESNNRVIQFQASATLCCARVSCSLDLNAAIDQLPKTLTLVLQQYDSSQPIALISASTTALARLIRHFAVYFGNFLLPVIEQTAKLRIRLSELYKEREKHEQMTRKLDALDVGLCEKLSLRQLLEVFTNVYDKLAAVRGEALLAFISTLVRKTITKATKNDQEEHKFALNSLLFKMLSFRSAETSATISTSLVNRVEQAIIQLVCFVLPRYKERNFRLFYNHFIQWPTSELPSGKDQSTVLKQRLITFYSAQCALSQSLRELFTLLVLPGLAPNAVERLTDEWTDVSGHIEPEVRHAIVLPLLQTIGNSLQYGYSSSTSSEQNNELAERLIDPVVQQLGKDYAGQAAYEKRIEEGVGLCVAAFVRGCGNFNKLKQLHMQILPHTRARSEHVRLASLNVLQQFIAGSAEEYVTYLPDAVPFLVELYEDNSETVQKRLVGLLRDVEQLIGEPISNYM